MARPQLQAHAQPDKRGKRRSSWEHGVNQGPGKCPRNPLLQGDGPAGIAGEERWQALVVSDVVWAESKVTGEAGAGARAEPGRDKGSAPTPPPPPAVLTPHSGAEPDSAAASRTVPQFD